MRPLPIHDLDSAVPTEPIDTDVCILGAGPVGLTAARGLASRGLRVTILEAGGLTPRVAGNFPRVRFDRREYRGASAGRAFGLGGTSSLWGGQLLPIRPADLQVRQQVRAPAWPISYADIEPYFLELEKLLQIRAGDFETSADPREALGALDFMEWAPRQSKWLPFRQRNLAAAWHRQFGRDSGIEVWLNATATGWRTSGAPGQRVIEELIARSTTGHLLRIRPRVLVVACGALETARTLLELDAVAGPFSPGVTAHTGRHLHDHLSMRLARVRVADARGFEDRFAPVFEDGIMRSLRMELSPTALERDGLPALYAHFLAEADESSGFAVLRDCLRFAQRRDVRQWLLSMARVPRALPGILEILHARYVKHRLAFPRGSEIVLQIDFEQAPRRENRVYLANTAPDGGTELHIDWDVDDCAAQVAHGVRRHMEAFWRRNRLEQVAVLDFIDPGQDPAAWVRNLHDIYHPAGTARMAADPQNGVVDPDLKLHGSHNIYVAGSAVFPSMGAANPTFTAMALALRMADHISRSLQHGTA